MRQRNLEPAFRPERSGVAELPSNAPLAPDAHFHIASNTKVFVATVTLQLVGEVASRDEH